MIVRTFSALVFVSLIACSPSAQAGVISHSPAIVILDPAPTDVTSGALSSNSQFFVFTEQHQFVLDQDLPVDITVPGTSPQGADRNLSPDSIPTGTRIHSYLLHFDTVGGTAANPIALSGWLTFSHDILGLIVRSATLNGTDAMIGIPGLIYTAGSARGLELDLGDNALDHVTLGVDRRTVSLNMLNANGRDQVRIITNVPEPSSIVLTSLGVLGLLAVRWRRQNHRTTTPF